MNILRWENERENKDKNMLTGKGMEEDSSSTGVSQELFIQYVDSDQRHQGCFKLCLNYKKEEAK